MQNRYLKWTSVVGIALLGAAIGLRAAEKTMTPDEQKAMMMQQMQKYGTPGPNHLVLKQAEGRWTHTIRSWMKPGDKPDVSLGTSENTMVLDGRYLQQKAHGEWNGKPFEGLGYTGYDNVRGEFQSVWMDNMVTGMMLGSGSYDAPSKTVQQSGHFSCPITGDKAMWYRSEWKITDADNQTYSMYGKTPDGKEFKSMEIVYKRMK
jgi:hypothetical protein